SGRRPVLVPVGGRPGGRACPPGGEGGGRWTAAELNGRLVPLASELGDRRSVEVLTPPRQGDEFDFDEDEAPTGPSPEWLDFVKTPHARLHISHWFNGDAAPSLTIASKVRLGRLAVGLALRQRGRWLTTDMPLVRLSADLGYPDLETLLVAVADHTVTADEVVERLIATVDHTPR